MERPLAVLFSDRRRGLKAGISLALIAALAAGFNAGPTRKDLGFIQLSRLPEPGLPPGKTVGPEHIEMKVRREEELVGEKFGVTLRFTYPETAAAGPLRAVAAGLRPGDYFVATGYHLGGDRFELVSLRKNRLRALKLLVSGLAALIALALFPVYHRWDRGRFRARS
jgi:hypothetical protein